MWLKLILNGLLLAQISTTLPPPTTHYMTVSWVAPSDIANPPAAGSGYNLFRASGLCPAIGLPPSATQLNTSLLTVTTVYDTSVTVGSSFCYYVVAVVGGVNSAPSNDAGATIRPFAATGVQVVPN